MNWFLPYGWGSQQLLPLVLLLLKSETILIAPGAVNKSVFLQVNEIEYHFVPYSKWLCTFRGRVNSHLFHNVSPFNTFSVFLREFQKSVKGFESVFINFIPKLHSHWRRINPEYFCKLSKALNSNGKFLISKVRILINPDWYFICSTNVSVTNS